MDKQQAQKERISYLANVLSEIDDISSIAMQDCCTALMYLKSEDLNYADGMLIDHLLAIWYFVDRASKRYPEMFEGTEDWLQEVKENRGRWLKEYEGK